MLSGGSQFAKERLTDEISGRAVNVIQMKDAQGTEPAGVSLGPAVTWSRHMLDKYEKFKEDKQKELYAELDEKFSPLPEPSAEMVEVGNRVLGYLLHSVDALTSETLKTMEALRPSLFGQAIQKDAFQAIAATDNDDTLAALHEGLEGKYDRETIADFQHDLLSNSYHFPKEWARDVERLGHLARQRDQGKKLKLALSLNQRFLLDEAEAATLAGGADTFTNEPDFRFYTLQDLEALPEPSWLVAGLLPSESIGVMWGVNQSGKTFLELDRLLSIASGKPWFACEVRQSRVLYMAGEAAGHIRFRVAMWCQQNPDYAQAARENFRVCTDSLSLTDTGQMRRFSRLAKRQSIEVVTFDTLSVFAADANLDTDANPIYQGLRIVRDAVGIGVTFLHHCGWGKGNRPANARRLIDNADWALGVEIESGSTRRTVSCNKLKDRDKPAPWNFEIGGAPLDGHVDEHGRPRVAGFITPADSSTWELNPVPPAKLGNYAKAIHFASTLAPHESKLPGARLAIAIRCSTAAAGEALKRMARSGYATKEENGYHARIDECSMSDYACQGEGCPLCIH